METVWWLLKQIYDKGLIYKGYTIQPYSPKAGTGLSSHELNQPGTYQDVTDTTVTAQFEVVPDSLPDFLGQEEGKISLLAWTTTPWTLPSNTALAVGPKIDYVLVETLFRSSSAESLPKSPGMANGQILRQGTRKFLTGFSGNAKGKICWESVIINYWIMPFPMKIQKMPSV